MQTKVKQLETRTFRFTHDFLFSVNLALVATLEGNQKPNRFFSLLDSGQESLQYRLNALLRLHPHSQMGAYSAFLFVALAIALAIFLALRVCSMISLIEKLLRAIAAVISLLALPLAWLFVSYMTERLPQPLSQHHIAFMELAAVTALVVYIGRKPEAPRWPAVFLLILYFSFWYVFISGGPYFWRDPFKLIFSIAGLSASYVGIISRHRSTPSPSSMA